MNSVDNLTLNNANEEAIYNTFMYLAKYIPETDSVVGLDFNNAVNKLNQLDKSGWKTDELRQLQVINNALNSNEDLASSRLLEYATPEYPGVPASEYNESRGMNACIFKKSDGEVSVVFRGTGDGEWIDNGEGLSGVPEENVYNVYDSNGNIIDSHTETGYATEQQMNALNWFNEMKAEYGWDENTNLVVSGHSKGGNTAQFITINSDLVDNCYSFDGQGFSPEALNSFADKYGLDYEKRRQRIMSFCCYNDYVNVLGERAVPEDHVIYFNSAFGDENVMGYHYMDDILDETGKFNMQREQGEFSEYIMHMSSEIMDLPPEMRQSVTLGLMNVAQSFLGDGVPVNGDSVSVFTTALGTYLGAIPVLEGLLESPEGIEALSEIGVNLIKNHYEDIREKYDGISELWHLTSSTVVLAVAIPAAVFVGKAVVDFVGFKGMITDLCDMIRVINSEVFSRISSFVAKALNYVSHYFNSNFNYGYRYAQNNPYIKLDTNSLREYAARLDSVNNRLHRLDSRLNRLYSHVSLVDLYPLIRADLMIGYSWKIKQCAIYLRSVASEFENAERTISSRL